MARGFSCQTYARFLPESCSFDGAQKDPISSVKAGGDGESAGGRRGKAAEQKSGIATAPSARFIDVGRLRERAAFILACRVLLLARKSTTVLDFEKYGGSWRSHSRAGISRLRAATLSALHLGGGPTCTFDYAVDRKHVLPGHSRTVLHFPADFSYWWIRVGIMEYIETGAFYE